MGYKLIGKGYIKTKDTDIVILCGGAGTRLRNIISDKPKALATVNGKPFIAYLIEEMHKFGFKRFILCTGYLGSQIRSYFKENLVSGVEIIFSEEKIPLGTGGAVKNAENLIKSNPFLIINGDTFAKIDFLEFFNFHLNNQALFSLALAHSENADNFGSVKLNSVGRVISFNEKDKAGQSLAIVSCGTYIMNRDVFLYIPKDKKFSLEYELFPILIKDKFLYGFIINAKFLDIGTPENYRKAQKILNMEKG